MIIITLNLVNLSCEKKNEGKVEPIKFSPIIIKVSPDIGYAGDVIQLIGKNFGEKKDDVQVYFGGQRAELTKFSSSVLSIVTPDLSGKVDVQVEVAGKKSTVFSFQYQNEAEDLAKVDKESIKVLMEQQDPLVWVFTGNSITQGAKHTHGLRPYPEIFAERVRWEMGRSRDYVVNTAISGNTLEQILIDFEHRVGQFEPQVVFCMIGTNDAATNNKVSVSVFSNQLISFVGRIRALGAVPVLLLPTPIITKLAPERATLWNYVARMREVAMSEQVILVDNWQDWDEELDQKYNGGVFRILMNDPLHPNGFGHKEIAISLFKELSIFDSSQPTGGGAYYKGEHLND